MATEEQFEQEVRKWIDALDVTREEAEFIAAQELGELDGDEGSPPDLPEDDDT